MAERYSPRDLPNAQILYALARDVLVGREHRWRQETNGFAGVPVGRLRFVLAVDSVEFWGTTWREVDDREGVELSAGGLDCRA